jgi:hypothetical protein
MQVQNLQLAFSFECIAFTFSHSHKTTGPVSVYIAREVTRTKKKLRGKKLEEVCSIPNNCTSYYIGGCADVLPLKLYSGSVMKKKLRNQSSKKSSIKDLLSKKQIHARSMASFSLGAFHV